MFKVISLKNITCRLQEDKHLEFLPLHFHAFLSTQPVLALYPHLKRNSLSLNYFFFTRTDYRLFFSFSFSLFFLSFFFFFLILFSHNRAYRISLNLNSTQLKVSVNRLLLDVSHICFGTPCSFRQWRLSPSLFSLLYRIAASVRTRSSIFRSTVRNFRRSYVS